jgi:hypothetical protein
VVVDAGNGGGYADESTSTSVWRVDADSQELITKLDVPLRFPVAWRSSDDAVMVVGINCPTLEDEAERPTCNDGPLVAAEIGMDGKVDTWDLGVTTLGDVGFSAGKLGSDGIALVAYDETAEPFLATIAKPGDPPVDHGPVGRKKVCTGPGATYLVPREVAESDRDVLTVTSQGPQKVGSIAPPAGQLTALVACSEGTALLQTMVADGVQTRQIDLSQPTKVTDLNVPAEFARGAVSLADGQLFAWVPGEARDAWQLADESSGTWQPRASVDSTEAPRDTVTSDGTYAAVIESGGRVVVEVIA